jgi:hypothetical protein
MNGDFTTREREKVKEEREKEKAKEEEKRKTSPIVKLLCIEKQRLSRDSPFFVAFAFEFVQQGKISS